VATASAGFTQLAATGSTGVLAAVLTGLALVAAGAFALRRQTA
jgi:LPXTG-motif cell wall-anchored protein